MPKLVLDLNDRRPAWALPSWVAEEVREALPSSWTLQVMDTEADGSGDGVATLSPALLEAVREAEIYLGYGVPGVLLREGRKLGWVHTATAGVGAFLTPEMRESPVLFTNAKGIHGPPMADTVLGMILYFARGLDFAVASQQARRWDTTPFYRADHPLVELSRATVGIFGFGGVGREVARRVRALGARVLAFDAWPGEPGPAGGEGAGEEVQGDSRREAPQVGPGPELLEDPGIEPLHGREGFQRLLEASDFLVLTAPETPETRGILDGVALDRMKSTATLVNVSRGALVEETALVEALREGRLRGAGLDVFWKEPLPGDHPLWELPSVLMTPHVSAVSRHFWRRQTDLMVENIRRYLAGRPLKNLVDKDAGF